MGMYFSLCDIMQTAVEIEKNGERFYSTLAEKVENPGVKILFEILAAEEKKHIIKLQNMQDSVTKKPLQCEFDEETRAYISALAGEVFTKEKLNAVLKKKDIKSEEAMRHAIDFEKNSILFFRELRQFVEMHDAKVMDVMIDQEKNHLTRLLEAKK